MTIVRIAVAGCTLAAAGAALACGEGLGAARTTVEGGKYTVAYATSPSPVVVGQHFRVDVAVCAKAGAPAARDLRVDATMPEHRHGMNYRPTVRQSSPGRWRAEGLLFHMPGRWEFAFQVHDGRRDDRVAAREDVR